MNLVRCTPAHEKKVVGGSSLYDVYDRVREGDD